MPDPVPVTAAQLNSIPEFRGEKSDSIDIVALIRIVDNAITQYNWEDAATAAAVKSRLRGNAAAWLEARECENLAYPAYAGNNGLKAALLAAFKKTSTVSDTVKALANLKQREGEQIETFRTRVILTLDKKDDDIPKATKLGDDYQNRLKSDQYFFTRAGLLPRYAKIVDESTTPPEDIASLVRVVKRIEQTEDQQTAAGQVAAVEQHPTSSIQSEIVKLKEQHQEEVAALQKQLSRFRGNGNSYNSRPQARGPPNASGNGRRNNIQCYKCGKFGHVAKKCYSNTNRDKKPNSFGNRNNQFMVNEGPHGSADFQFDNSSYELSQLNLNGK